MPRSGARWNLETARAIFYNSWSQSPPFPAGAMLNAELQSVVERLCEDGCRAVTQYIAEIETGHNPAPMQHLGRADSNAVLAELKAIMAVYARRPQN